MTGEFRVDGSWPAPITISRGWGRARARPWNGEAPDAFLRLERGRADFLRSVTEEVLSLAGSGVFSPAMFKGSTRIWEGAGYEQVRQLLVMERPLGVPIDEPGRPIQEAAHPDWDRILEIDRAAFDGFWRMSRHGLEEAFHSTSPSAVLVPGGEDRFEGYAIVGAQWGIAYLQRVAVDPAGAGRGLGTDLVRAALRWSRSTPAGSMVLNVRSENERARRLYRREGFSDTGNNLRILRYGATTLLN